MRRSTRRRGETILALPSHRRGWFTKPDLPPVVVPVLMRELGSYSIRSVALG